MNGVSPAARIPSMDREKLLQRLAQGALHNVDFDDMKNLIEGFGFRLAQVKGSHHIFIHPHIPELINLQNVQGQAKPYQIRQFLQIVERYNLHLLAAAQKAGKPIPPPRYRPVIYQTAGR